MLIYATAPVQKVVGEFNIRETVVDAPDAIWDEYGSVGVIDRDSFGAYYSTSDHAVAFIVDKATRYARPKALKDLAALSIPQSFYYLHRTKVPRRRRPTPTTSPGPNGSKI